MKDLPVFTTENGVASLILKEIPYKQKAFIKIQDSQTPELLLQECISFCTACGAERIYASGHECVVSDAEPVSMIEMRGEISFSPDELPQLFPVTEQTVSRWREIYNQKMKHIDNASTMEAKDEAHILSCGGAYFVHRAGKLLGIIMVEENHLSAIASLEYNAGESILKAAQSLMPGEPMVLMVASTNTKAIALYERMGFYKTKEISKWYCVK